MFIHGIDSPILEIVEYNLNNLEEILQIFLKKYQNVNETNRFNLALSGYERQYLDWVHFNTGKSRTQVIKQALKKMMDEDEGYVGYLRMNSGF